MEQEHQDRELSLYVGCPTYGKAGMEFSFDSVGSLMWGLGRHHPEIKKVWLQRDVRTYRQSARQSIVEAAIEANASHILMLDDDHTFGLREFDLLWEAITKQPDEVHAASALYFTRGLPTSPCIFTLTSQGTVPIFHYPKSTLMKVDATGFGFIIFQTEVFKKIPGPWFNLSMGFGEDVAWTTKMNSAGLNTYVHTGASIGHLLEQPVVIDEAMYEKQLAEAANRGTTLSDLRFVGVEPSFVGKGGSVAGGSEGVSGDGPGGETDRAINGTPWWRPISRRIWNFRDRGTKGTGEGTDPSSSAA